MKKKKMLVFHPVLAPSRIDHFNSLSAIFDLEVVFYLENMPSFNYDQYFLKSQCSFKISYLLLGFKITNRLFRFGIAHKIIEAKPDYILSYEYSPTTHYLLMLRKIGILKQKIGTSVDDNVEMCINPQTVTRKISRNSIIKKLDFVVLLSKEVAQFYNNEFNLSDNRIIISPFLQSEERLRKNEVMLENIASEYITKYNLKNKKVLLFIGRLVEEKGLKQFLTNIYNTIKNDSNLKIIIVGDGNEKENIEEFIKLNHLESSIILPGRFENINLYPWYLCASGFFLSSISEAFGAVINESLIFGLPVLCSKYAGATSLINSDNGIIFDPLDQNDTIQKSKLFIDKILPVNKVNLTDKPSLMGNYGDQLNGEWSKLKEL